MIQPNQTVAVVGAGAAGITLAVALALLNYHVTLYDRAGDILRLQSASTRLLHPHIYEWPRLGSLDERAGLPFLDWPAGNGKDVVLDLRTQFAVLRAPLPNLILKTGHDLKSTAQASGEWKLTFKTAGGDESRVVDHVMLTMGFGDERPCGTIAPDDYWAPSAVGTPATEASAVTAVSYVVSGNGDGALTVALGLLIQDFEHASFTHTFLDYFSRDQLRQAADAAFAGKTFEEDAEQDLRKHVLPTLIQYGAIDKLRQKLRTDRSLTLNTNGPQFAAGKASQLNQCMLLALLEAAAAESVKIVRSTGFVSGCTPTAEGIVLFGTTIAGHADNKAYKHAILRHGPDQVKRYEATGPLIADYRDYVLGLLAAHPERATPPLLHDATYDLFLDKRIERLAAGGAKAQQKAAASQERRVIEIATDPAAHVLVERGCICIIDIAEQCERLPERCTIDVHVAPNQIPDADDLVRLARCSGGKIELRAGDSVLALWDARLPGIASAPEPVSARAVREYVPAQLTGHIDACLVRRLDLKLQEAITNGGAAPLGDISPEILNHVASTWAAWRGALATSPELQYDFLRWLANVDQQTAQPWNGETGDAISDMTNALILIAAAHAGEPLVPCSNDFGNLGFSATALAIGTGSRAIGRKPLSSRTAPEDWGVDALILSAATDVIVSATAGTVLDAGDIGFTLKTPRKVPPAIIQNDARWRSRLGGPLADWQAAVTKEFAEWRERQDAEVARILV